MTIISPRSGFDLEYYISKVGERTAGGYYMSAAQNGERPGRWFGRGAAMFGLADGMIVETEPLLALYNLIDPRTGEKMPGRAPANYRHYYKILGDLLDLEPDATAERVRELEREAAQHTRRSALYTDFTSEHYKSVSIVHGSLRENIRRAKLAGNKDAEAVWGHAGGTIRGTASAG